MPSRRKTRPRPELGSMPERRGSRFVVEALFLARADRRTRARPPRRDRNRRRHGARLDRRCRSRVGSLARRAALRQRAAAALLPAACRPATCEAARAGRGGATPARGATTRRRGSPRRPFAPKCSASGPLSRAGSAGAGRRRAGVRRRGAAGRGPVDSRGPSGEPGRRGGACSPVLRVRVDARTARYSLDPLGDPAPRRRFGRGQQRQRETTLEVAARPLRSSRAPG